MASSLTTAVCVLCFALVFAGPAAAQTTSCIMLAGYYSPYHTYEMRETRNNGACCRLCAEDDRCVAWSRDPGSNLCALKNDTQVFVQLTGVTSGVKYTGLGRPTLIGGDVDALVLRGSGGPAPAGGSGGPVTAFASASSSEGTTSATVTATPEGITTSSGVSGIGRADVAASTPSISLATTLSSDGTEGPVGLSVVYFDQPSIRAELPTVLGKRVAVVADARNQPTCLTCPEFSCVYTRGIHYKFGGEIIENLKTRNFQTCCLRCRNNPLCRSWWRNPDNNRCVLQSNIPAVAVKSQFGGGTFI